MQATKGRRVRSGDEYDHYFPRADGKNSLVKGNASVEDTVKLIQENVPRCAWQVKRIAGEKLKGKNLYETCRKIWTFYYQHVPYARDEEGIEQVRDGARTWQDRKTPNKNGEVGVDCDCFSFSVGCCLFILGYRFKYRITKYPKPKGEIPKWQHIYIVVPKDQSMDRPLTKREDYIVIDCVKEDFDSEEPFLEFKDYNDMKLEFLSGLDEGTREYKVPNITDVKDIASVYGDIEEMGRLGGWETQESGLGKTIVGKLLHTVNRFTNPLAIGIRNGFLLAMKINIFNIAGRIKYGFLSDAQANQMQINPSGHSKLKAILAKVVKIYEGAGGKAQNLKKAILEGKGNKKRDVPLSGVEDYYTEQGADGLGLDPTTDAATLAPVIASLTAIAATLKQVGSLFPKNSPAAKSFDSESATADSPGASIQTSPTIQTSGDATQNSNNAITNNIAPAGSGQPAQQGNESADSSNNQAQVNTQGKDNNQGSDQKTLAAGENLLQKTTAWVKKNPVPSLLITGLVGFGIYKLAVRPKVEVKTTLSGITKKKNKQKINKKGDEKEKEEEKEEEKRKAKRRKELLRAIKLKA